MSHDLQDETFELISQAPAGPEPHEVEFFAELFARIDVDRATNIPKHVTTFLMPHAMFQRFEQLTKEYKITRTSLFNLMTEKIMKVLRDPPPEIRQALVERRDEIIAQLEEEKARRKRDKLKLMGNAATE
jgi:pheromone shutdown protein TraB